MCWGENCIPKGEHRCAFSPADRFASEHFKHWSIVFVFNLHIAQPFLFEFFQLQLKDVLVKIKLQLFVG